MVVVIELFWIEALSSGMVESIFSKSRVKKKYFSDWGRLWGNVKKKSHLAKSRFPHLAKSRFPYLVKSRFLHIVKVSIPY